MRSQVIELSSSLNDTPETMYIVDRLCNFHHGFHGDIELYNDPVLLAMREIQQRIEDAVLYGNTQEGDDVMLPDGTVGVDEYSRFRVIDGDKCQIEYYPWLRRAPHLAVVFAWDVFMWHVRMVRQHGWKQWTKDRKL